LLDEIEKAHPDVFNILLQVLEDGRLTDSFGRTVDFRNTILIMTSNIGTENLVKGSLGFQATDEVLTYEDMKGKLTDQLKKTFRPEFLNRVDEVIIFRSLGREELKKIVDIELEEVKTRLKEKEVEIELSQKAKDFLIDHGYDPNYGARPLRRAIQRYVEDPLAEEIIKKKFEHAKGILVDVDRAGTGLTFKEKT
jgi:ATP-dependent Clp protease ATP-binding subunit ClpC